MERVPVVAGRFYPEDPDDLTAEIDRRLGAGGPSAPAIAAIVPHGSLEIVGDLQATVYRQVEIPSVVVLLCGSHVGDASGGSIMTHGTFRVPGGAVPIDTRFAEELRSLALLTEDEAPHRSEHAIETQLPFLLRRNPRVRIVPVTFGPMSGATCTRIGSALAEVVNAHSRDALVVGISNLSHYLPAEACETHDERFLAPMRALDVEGLYAAAQSGHEPDGLAPIAVVLATAIATGANSAELLAHTTSAATAGEADRAVGYAGLVIR